MKIDDNEREKWVALLRGVKFFDGFEEDDLGRLLDAGKVRHYKFHEFVFRENDEDPSFFVILKGSVKIIKLAQLNKKKEVGKLGEGDCFGEMGLLLKTKRSAGILAAEECFIFQIDADDIESMPELTQTRLYRRFAESLADRLRSATEHMIRPF